MPPAGNPDPAGTRRDGKEPAAQPHRQANEQGQNQHTCLSRPQGHIDLGWPLARVSVLGPDGCSVADGQRAAGSLEGVVVRE
jgi:hypothetical protein